MPSSTMRRLGMLTKSCISSAVSAFKTRRARIYVLLCITLAFFIPQMLSVFLSNIENVYILHTTNNFASYPEVADLAVSAVDKVYLLDYLRECQAQTGDASVRKHYIAYNSSPTRETPDLCPCLPTKDYPLDKAEVMSLLEMNRQFVSIEREHFEVSNGGSWRPRDCHFRSSVAIIIPYRNRESHLKVWLHYMHYFLQRQLVSYQIFVVEQASPELFNRASLMNVGYLTAREAGPFDCYIFHDVDLLPESDFNLYTCVWAPTHIGAYMNKFDYKIPYNGFFGGAIALTGRQVELINGFPNIFYGWGGEDDDIYNRIIDQNFTIHRQPPDLARTYMISHDSDKDNPVNPRRYLLMDELLHRADRDGLNTVKYHILSSQARRLHSWVHVALDKSYKEECIVNSEAQPGANDNYVDCYTEDNFLQNTIDCCREDGRVFCCDRRPLQNRYKVVIVIAAGVAVIVILVLVWRIRRKKNCRCTDIRGFFKDFLKIPNF